MVGYPYYNDVDLSTNDNVVYFSEYVLESNRALVCGFIFGVGFAPSIVTAAETVPTIIEGAANNTTQASNFASWLVAGGACAGAGNCLKDGVSHITSKAADKVPPNAMAIIGIGCAFLIGWCTGQVVDKVIKKAI